MNTFPLSLYYMHTLMSRHWEYDSQCSVGCACCVCVCVCVFVCVCVCVCVCAFPPGAPVGKGQPPLGMLSVTLAGSTHIPMPFIPGGLGCEVEACGVGYTHSSHNTT